MNPVTHYIGTPATFGWILPPPSGAVPGAAQTRVYRTIGGTPFASKAELANARISLFGTWY